MIIAYALLLIMPIVVVYYSMKGTKRNPRKCPASGLIVEHWYEVSGIYSHPIHVLYKGMAKGNDMHFQFPNKDKFNDIYINSEVWQRCRAVPLNSKNI